MRTCAVVGCERPIKCEFLMCGDHWRKVPAAVQIEIYNTLRKVERLSIHVPRTEWETARAAYEAAVEKAKKIAAERSANALRP